MVSYNTTTYLHISIQHIWFVKHGGNEWRKRFFFLPFDYWISWKLENRLLNTYPVNTLNRSILTKNIDVVTLLQRERENVIFNNIVVDHVFWYVSVTLPTLLGSYELMHISHNTHIYYLLYYDFHHFSAFNRGFKRLSYMTDHITSYHT